MSVSYVLVKLTTIWSKRRVLILGLCVFSLILAFDFTCTKQHWHKWSDLRPKVNIGPWDKEFNSIRKGSQLRSWWGKWPIAYRKGNIDVGSPVRTELLTCKYSRLWREKIMHQVTYLFIIHFGPPFGKLKWMNDGVI